MSISNLAVSAECWSCFHASQSFLSDVLFMHVNTLILNLKDIIVLFFGGIVMALAIESSGLHRRISLNIIALFGVNPRLLTLG